MTESIKHHILATIMDYYIDKPIYSGQLEKIYDISGITVRNIVRQLRREGHPIASGSNGYYYARYKTELVSTINNLRSRANDLLKTANILEAAYTHKSGQTTLI
tara:strand:+ start:98 stop:409 length:312 start_codon:yes stop_codon:yes gene_type:complete